MSDLYAVVGNPVTHSKSPTIHQMFAEQTGQALKYSAIAVEIGQFSQALSDFKAKKFKGLNVTVPFKQDAWANVNQRRLNAEKAGAVNTIIFADDGQLIGDNTDGVGLVRDISQNLQFSLHNKRVLILGAGGAVRGVLGPILAAQTASVVIANRTVAKADELAELFADEGKISSSSFEALQDQQFDLIINGTAASLSGDLPPVPADIYMNACCYDMMYSKQDTVFMANAKQNGAKQCWDGLGMLVEQAAESFYLWRGVRPETAEVITAVRNSF